MNKIKKAMQKARMGTEEEHTKPRREPASRRPKDEPPLSVERRKRQRRPDEIQPEYVVTRVESSNPEVLRANKVMHICTEWRMSDQLKILRTQVLNRLSSAGNSILVTSANPGEGKTFTAVNLAVSIAQELNRTALLVDADLRKPSIHERFGLQPERGLVDYLLQRAELPEVLVNPGIPKLTLLPAGRGATASAELLGAPRMESLVEEMTKRYPDRFLVFDSSSVLSTAEPLVFSRFVGGILLVVESERTSRDDVKRTLERLEGRPLVGIVQNKTRA